MSKSELHFLHAATSLFFEIDSHAMRELNIVGVYLPITHESLDLKDFQSRSLCFLSHAEGQFSTFK